MIVIRMELWPGGDKSRAEHLGTATIANVNRMDDMRHIGNYEYLVMEHSQSAEGDLVEVFPESRFNLSQRGSAKKKWKSGGVAGFPRLKLGAWDLLYRVLQSAVGNRNVR